MKMRAEQLASHLADSSNRPPCYLVYGEEPLLVVEAADAIRAALLADAETSREVFHLEPGFDWQRFAIGTTNGSLFAERRLIELRIGDQKLGDPGSKALQAYCDAPPAETIILMTAGRIDAQGQRSRWFRAIEQIGVTIGTWPPRRDRLDGWILTRARNRADGLQLTAEGAAFLAQRVEGNLLAAAQEIDKLALLFEPGAAVSAEQLASCLEDSTRYDIFDLTDAAVRGNFCRGARILNVLRNEGIDPILVLWGLSREVRLICTIHQACNNGQSMTRALSNAKVVEFKKPLIAQAVQRLSGRQLKRILQRCAGMDQRFKGAPSEGLPRPWDELLALLRALCQGSNRIGVH